MIIMRFWGDMESVAHSGVFVIVRKTLSYPISSTARLASERSGFAYRDVIASDAWPNRLRAAAIPYLLTTIVAARCLS